MDDRQEFLDQFLLYGHVLTADEIEGAGEDGVPHTPPLLEQYKEQVDTYEKIYANVMEFEVSITKVHSKYAHLQFSIIAFKSFNLPKETTNFDFSKETNFVNGHFDLPKETMIILTSLKRPTL